MMVKEWIIICESYHVTVAKIPFKAIRKLITWIYLENVTRLSRTQSTLEHKSIRQDSNWIYGLIRASLRVIRRFNFEA